MAASRTAVSLGVQVSDQVPVFNSFEYIPRMELLDRVTILGLIFEDPPYCFPQQLHRFRFTAWQRCTGAPAFPRL